MKSYLSIDCATVVDREIRGESSLYTVVYAPDAGLLRTMKRLSAKRTSPLPDLFDDIALDCEASSPTALQFAKDFSLKKRRTEIASSYEAFEHAALIAQTVLRNGGHIENSAQLSQRLRMSLDAIAEGSPAEIVRLKFMYLLARDEGYAVREDFVRRLGRANAELFGILIKNPSSELREFKSRAVDMLEKLCAWIYSSTDIAE